MIMIRYISPVLSGVLPALELGRQFCRHSQRTLPMMLTMANDQCRQQHRTTTRVALLAQRRQDPTDQAGWSEFVQRYGPHIYRWCRRWNLQDADAEDLTQTILFKLTQKLRAFAYDPSRSFRG